MRGGAILARVRRLPLVAFGALLAIALVWLVVGLLIPAEYARHARQAERDLGNLARLLEAQMAGRHARIDAVLRFGQALYRDNPDGFRLGPWTRIADDDDIIQGELIGPDGFLRASTLGLPATPVYLGDRDYVRAALAADAPDELSSSPPLLGRVSKRETVNFARPLRRADGTPDGAIMLSADAASFARQYDALDMPASRMLLFGLDGIIRARVPGPAPLLGQRLPDYVLAPFRAGAKQVTTRRPSLSDGADMFVALRRIEGFPLVVGVSLAAHEALADARRSAWWLAGAGALTSLLILALAWGMVRLRSQQVAARARLEAAIAHVGQGIMMVDPDGRIALANQRVQQLLELPPGLAARGRRILDVIAWQEQAGEFGGGPAPRLHQVAADTAPAAPQLSVRQRPNGTVLEVRTEYLADGSQVRTFSDVTAAQRAAESIAAARDQALAAEAALAAALEQVPHGVLLQGADGRVQLMNSQALALLGLPADLAAPGRHVSEIIAWQKRHNDLSSTPNPERPNLDMRVGIEADVPTYERRTPDGRLLEIRTTGLADGRIIRTYTDVTARHGALREQAAAREAAEDALRARTEFLAVVSHELRTPLNAVIGLSGVLLMQSPAAMQIDALKMIEAAGRQLLGLVESILELTRLERGQVSLQEATFDPRALLQEAAAGFAGPAATKQLALIVAPDPGLPAALLGDEGRLRQVLQLLLGNALKFTEAGSVTLAARMLEGVFELSVADTGIGIAPALHEALFEPFVQADSSAMRRFGGAGLGLALCRLLLEAMGGSIAVESAPGQGSTFRCRLPLRLAPARVAA